MYLHNKYLIGFGILGISGLSLLFFGPALFPQFDAGEYYTLLGIVTIGVSIFYAFLLFAPERIRGYKAEYEATPDLTEFRVVKTLSKPGPTPAEIPEVAYCGTCGKRIHKPFHCSLCGQFLCGKHYLKGEHACINGV